MKYLEIVFFSTDIIILWQGNKLLQSCWCKGKYIDKLYKNFPTIGYFFPLGNCIEHQCISIIENNKMDF